MVFKLVGRFLMKDSFGASVELWAKRPEDFLDFFQEMVSDLGKPAAGPSIGQS